MENPVIQAVAANSAEPATEKNAAKGGKSQRGPAFDLASPELYLNRELTWLEFNKRVLQEIDSVEERQSKGSRLPRSGLSLAQYVLTAKATATMAAITICSA